VREIRCEKFIGWRDWLDGVTRLSVAVHPHRTKTFQSLVHGGPPESKSTFKYCAGKILVFPVLWLNRKNSVTVQVLLFVFQLRQRFRLLENKSLRELLLAVCNTSFTPEIRRRVSTFIHYLFRVWWQSKTFT
jgi:hypothetical protein